MRLTGITVLTTGEPSFPQAGVLADDDAIVDRETFIVDALSRLEAPHIKVLGVVSETSRPQRNGVLYKTYELACRFRRSSGPTRRPGRLSERSSPFSPPWAPSST